jgi:hypothetical protein
VPDAQANEPQTIVRSLRNEFACPGMHVQWPDEKDRAVPERATIGSSLHDFFDDCLSFFFRGRMKNRRSKFR